MAAALPRGGPLSQAVLWPLSLDDLEAFMKVARTGLTMPLKEGDYDGLVQMMGHLMKVKERQVATDTMFEPLKQTIELLKTYGEEMPEETLLKLQVHSSRPAVCLGVGGPEPRASRGGRKPGALAVAGGEGCGHWGQGLPRGPAGGTSSSRHGSPCTARWPQRQTRFPVCCCFLGLKMPPYPTPPPECWVSPGVRLSGQRLGSAEALQRLGQGRGARGHGPHSEGQRGSCSGGVQPSRPQASSGLHAQGQTPQHFAASSACRRRAGGAGAVGSTENTSPEDPAPGVSLPPDLVASPPSPRSVPSSVSSHTDLLPCCRHRPRPVPSTPQPRGDQTVGKAGRSRKAQGHPC